MEGLYSLYRHRLFNFENVAIDFVIFLIYISLMQIPISSFQEILGIVFFFIFLVHLNFCILRSICVVYDLVSYFNFKIEFTICGSSNWLFVLLFTKFQNNDHCKIKSYDYPLRSVYDCCTCVYMD